jgi:hypothetical protein
MKTLVQHMIGFGLITICQKWFQRQSLRSGIFV